MKQGQMADWLLFLGDGIDRGISLRRLVNMSQRLYPKWQGMFDEIDQAMLMGKPFAEALGPWLSVDTYYQLRLAERHGKLAETIHQVGKFLALQAKQRARLRAVMQYPVILLVFLVLVIVMVIHFVLPEVASWGSGAGLAIPPLVTTIGLTCAGVLLASAVLLGVRWMTMDPEQRVRFLCTLPVIGRPTKYYWSYYLVANVAVMVENGMSLQEISRLVGQFDQRSMLYLVGQKISGALARGRPLEAVVSHLDYLPRELPSFLNRGLTQRELGEELAAVARLNYQRLSSRSSQLLELTQPLILVMIAAVVVVMYLSILMPIYQSLQVVE
ncbi:type II secretion system F family protein [Limosilactobacillus fermentum]|nr:type II secretion system F family protein [Limosilactobacillus fermentum]MCS8619740.1 competence protein [Limosilactobacillus fermentum]MCT3438553.1 competence protein [Limosilactobacillus fermentum]QWS03160.1 type II secretion system F family protein [Limosilactobacillus fermentum]